MCGWDGVGVQTTAVDEDGVSCNVLHQGFSLE